MSAPSSSPGEELSHLRLRENGWRVAAAESLTSGHVQALIGAVSGASRYFVGGVTAYTLEQKVRLLGVDAAIAEPVNCVSQHVAEQMAFGACGLLGANAAVATTGFAEPDKEKGASVPYAWWAVCLIRDRKVKFTSGRVEFPSLSRVAVQQAVAHAAVRALAECLRKAG
jgi:nicotinamide-nucleotide amidase